MDQDPTPPPPLDDPYPRPQPMKTTAADHLIPTKNPPALTSYYLGISSILPFFGLVTGAGGVWLGVLGLKKIKEQPGLPGKTHAFVGMGCGLVGFVFNALIVGGILVAVLSRR